MSEFARADVLTARSLVMAIAGHAWRGKQDAILRAHGLVSSIFPHWSERRVRAIWHKEAARIDFHEMVDLAVVADRLDRVGEYRHERNEFIRKTARLQAALECTDADFHRDHIDALRHLAGGSDLSGR